MVSPDNPPAVDDALIERVALACRVLGKLDATHGAFGHVSARVEGGSMLIKGKGLNEAALRDTKPEDILKVRFDVKEWSGGSEGVRPPSESYLHAWIYKMRPDVMSVVHMHPRSSVLLTVCGKELKPIYAAYGHGGRIAAEGVRTYGSSVIVNDDTRGETFAGFLGGDRAALMRGHGVTVVGSGIEDATLSTLALKEILDITADAYMIGEPQALPDDEVAEIRAPLRADRPFGSVGGDEGMKVKWRYFCSTAGESASL